MLTTHENYFACIGSAKCGTTWLHSYLRFNTTAHMPAIKEFHWFDEPVGEFGFYRQRSATRWQTIQDRLTKTGGRLQLHQKQFRDHAALRTDADYKEFFKTYCNPGSVFGDVTPAYSLLDKEGFTRIKALFPKVKFVFLMRNPADRLWSMLNMIAQRTSNFDIDKDLETRILLSYAGTRSDYKRTFETAVSVVGRENMFTAFHEDMFGEKQTDVLAKLCKFLGIEGHDIKPETLKDNRRKYDALPPQKRKEVVETFLPLYQWAQSEFGEVPENWLQDMAV